MKNKDILFYLLISLTSAVYLNANAEVIFSDSFESGDMESTNADRFDWVGSGTTSVVNSTHEVNTNHVPTNTLKSEAMDFPGGNWDAKHKAHSLRFRYPKGADIAEQDYRLGNPYRDIWMSFWLRVPENYYHRPISPGNQKLLAIYMDDYSYKGAGPTIIFSPWPDGNGGSTLDVKWGLGGTVVGVNGQTSREVPFITYPDDQGKWMHLVFHFKTSSTATSADGIITMWRKWQGETSHTMLLNKTNTKCFPPDTGPDGWHKGYLMGWVNAPYNTDTEFLIDDFKLSTTSLVGLELEPPTGLTVE